MGIFHVIVFVLLFSIGGNAHSVKSVAVLGGITKISDDLLADTRFQNTLGLQFEHSVFAFSYVLTFLHSEDTLKSGSGINFVETITIRTQELRAGLRYRMSPLYLGGGLAHVHSLVKSKRNAGSVLQPTGDRIGESESESVTGVYFEVGKDWRLSRNIRIGFQYNTVIPLVGSGTSAFSDSVFLGTFAYRLWN